MKRLLQDLKLFFNKLTKKQKIVGGSLIGGILLFLFIVFSGGSDSIKLIPKDAFFVAVINVRDVASKADLEDLEKTEWGTEASTKLEEDPIIKKLKDKPLSTGIDLTSDIFVFGLLKDGKTDPAYLGFTMDIWDEDDFKAFSKEALQDYFSSDNDYIDEEIGTEYSFRLVADSKREESRAELIVCWDDEKALVLKTISRISSKDLKAKAQELMSLDEKERVTAISSFKDFYRQKTEMCLWINPKPVLDNLPSRDYKELSNIVDISLIEDNYLAMFLEFKDDGIYFNLQTDLNGQVKEMTDVIFNKSFDRKLLDLVPNDSYAIATLSMNMDVSYALLRSQLDGKFQKPIERFERTFNEELGFDIQELLKSLGGNGLIALLELPESDDIPIPKLAFAFDSENEEYVDRIINRLQRELPPDVSLYYDKGYWKLTNDEVKDLEVYIASRNGSNVVTNDYDCLQKYLRGGYGNESLSRSKMASRLLEANLFFYMNTDLNDLPDAWQSTMAKSVGGFNMLDKINAYIQGIEISASAKEKNSMEFVLHTEYKGGNALNGLIRLVGDVYWLQRSKAMEEDEPLYYKEERYRDRSKEKEQPKKATPWKDGTQNKIDKQENTKNSLKEYNSRAEKYSYEDYE